ncbi:crossover junction endodeoxyribonuclease RuvC [Humibacter ginsenosidimutans]|uniref:Crossover junction endodeoxyribonuclease RuvC n=1 Tax=Humibacter ginsenosidimutans TaxID=2599293 RepID=A0A5B8M8T9_9MICO|nr:crossover junction endodeoxyribonuclease RuvC [Humibacter ginsenosidimutans]QDZ16649.1 crossover junction endodeoxyribonuclease RuvC [Humibacter ginsenosidimutans]
MRVLGIDPGLTRCGVGVVDVAPDRRATLVAVTVIRSAPDLALERRLLTIGDGIEALMDEHKPDAVAIERVFAQHNVRTVMGVAQISGVALHSAAKRHLPVGLHTPSEVKAAITGYGTAEKRQVQNMVAKVLGMTEIPKPADAADALAIAICHAWNAPLVRPDAGGVSLTPAQQAWRAAEKTARGSVGTRRLAK